MKDQINMVVIKRITFTPWLETTDWVAVVCAPSSQAAPGAPLSIMYVDIL